MSDDLDFDMEVVEDDDLDELGSGNTTDSERRSRTGRKEPVERQTENSESRSQALETREKGSTGSSVKKHRSDTDANVRGENYITGFGRFPSDWKKKGIAECAQIRDSERIPLNSSEREEMQPGNIPYYGANGVVDYVNDYIFDSELILLAEDGGHFEEYEERPVAYRVSGKAWINNHAHILEAKDGINTEYLFYSLEHRNLVPYVSGSTRSKLTQSMLRKVRVPIPPSPEQRKTASVLYAVDQAIQKTEAIIEQAQRVKRGLMQDFFEEGYDSHSVVKERIGPRLRRVPASWDVVRIGDLADYQNGYGFSKTDWTEHGRPIIRIQDLTRPEESETNYFSGEIDSKYEVEEGDILVSWSATLGVFRWDRGDAVLNQHIFKVRNIRDIVDRTFLYYALKYALDELERKLHGSTMKHVTRSAFENTEVPLPGLQEQRKIASVLDDLDSQIRAETNSRNRLNRLKKGLMQDLLTGEVRTADKAIEILDEVKALG